MNSETLTTQEFYAVIGSEYSAMLSRMRTEERVHKFLKLFEKDDSFSNLCQALGEQNYESAFRAAHTLKGLSLNLSFDALAVSSSALAECLRNPPYDVAAISPLFSATKKDYFHLAVCLGKLV